MEEKHYIIDDIVFKRTGETRTDGKYPDRIGSEVVFIWDPVVGFPLYFSYIKNNKGEPIEKDSWSTRTSRVDDFDYFSSDGCLLVYTRNSIYYFRELN